jgi:hypothetical protein
MPVTGPSHETLREVREFLASQPLITTDSLAEIKRVQTSSSNVNSFLEEMI